MKKFLLTAVLAFTAAWVFAQERIAVFPFEDMDNVLTRNEAVMFYQEFSNEFTNRSVGRFSVVPRQDIERLINTEAAFQLSDFSERVKTAEMQRVLNGTQILSGRIGKLGNDIRIIVSLYTYPELVQLPGGTTLSVANKNELFSKIPELVRNMQNEIIGTVTQPIPEGLLYEIVDGRTVTITGYVGDAVTLNIPEYIQGLPVTTIRWIGEIGVAGPTEPFNLTSITIPVSVTSIVSNGVVAYCLDLTSITVDDRNPVYASIDGVLFDKNIRTLIQYPIGRNQRTYVIPSSVTFIEDCAFYFSKFRSVTIPYSVTSIGNGAFYGTDLPSLHIPFSVTSIGDEAFKSNSLTNLTIDNRNPAYASIDGVLFDKNIRTLISYPIGKQGTYIIPSSVTTIGYGAFSQSNLTSVTIPSSVTSIGAFAFHECLYLTSVIIPSSVMSIGDYAFYDSGLTSVTLPRRTQVGERAFPPNARITYRD